MNVRCQSETYLVGHGAGMVRRKLCELFAGHAGPHLAYADDEHYWQWNGGGHIETPDTKLVPK